MNDTDTSIVRDSSGRIVRRVMSSERAREVREGLTTTRKLTGALKHEVENLLKEFGYNEELPAPQSIRTLAIDAITAKSTGDKIKAMAAIAAGTVSPTVVQRPSIGQHCPTCGALFLGEVGADVLSYLVSVLSAAAVPASVARPGAAVPGGALPELDDIPA